MRIDANSIIARSIGTADLMVKLIELELKPGHVGGDGSIINNGPLLDTEIVGDCLFRSNWTSRKRELKILKLRS